MGRCTGGVQRHRKTKSELKIFNLNYCLPKPKNSVGVLRNSFVLARLSHACMCSERLRGSQRQARDSRPKPSSLDGEESRVIHEARKQVSLCSHDCREGLSNGCDVRASLFPDKNSIGALVCRAAGGGATLVLCYGCHGFRSSAAVFVCVRGVR